MHRAINASVFKIAFASCQNLRSKLLKCDELTIAIMSSCRMTKSTYRDDIRPHCVAVERPLHLDILFIHRRIRRNRIFLNYISKRILAGFRKGLYRPYDRAIPTYMYKYKRTCKKRRLS